MGQADCTNAINTLSAEAGMAPAHSHWCWVLPCDLGRLPSGLKTSVSAKDAVVRIKDGFHVTEWILWGLLGFYRHTHCILNNRISWLCGTKKMKFGDM